MGLTGIDHVQLLIPPGAEEEARAFYAGVLGLTEVPKPAPLAPAGGCWFVGPGFSLHFSPDPAFVPARRAHVALLTDDLAGLRTRLDKAGTPTVDDDDRPIGVRRFYAFDPFGNRLELLDAREAGFSSRPAGGGPSADR
ncbi:MAG TPA: VOC family protein [Candidatus Limnocylindria bacterium]|nr:VOC family protein [Candidatus Limnocylindria bacterium]